MLGEEPGEGRPASFTPLQAAQVKALACQLPAESGTPLARWSAPELARKVVARAIVGTISASTVRRFLKQDALKPWQYQSWIFTTDPAFRPKAERILDLYARTWQGEALSADEYVISAGEKNLRPGLLPQSPRPGPRAGQGDAGEPHLRPRRVPGLSRRLRRSPREGRVVLGGGLAMAITAAVGQIANVSGV
ncbi:helix-turn-helix domain-containing protein [Kitasatospora sp. NPDC088346]|uniref:helix-turn-helix domain-containing protein n=1 Tax=Kitasatospora sp. NPDC088346 TaxID=3364073 RepID=UPI0037FC6272